MPHATLSESLINTSVPTKNTSLSASCIHCTAERSIPNNQNRLETFLPALNEANTSYEMLSHLTSQPTLPESTSTWINAHNAQYRCEASIYAFVSA